MKDKTKREGHMQKITLTQNKDRKCLQPNLGLRLQIPIHRNFSTSIRSFGFQRYYASQSLSSIDRKDFIHRPPTQRISPYSQIYYGRPRQNKETSTMGTNSKKLVYPLPDSIL